jgi:hypothetical protein
MSAANGIKKTSLTKKRRLGILWLTEGSPYDGEVSRHIGQMREMKRLRQGQGTPSPTKGYLETLAAVFEVIVRLPLKTRRAKAYDERKKTAKLKSSRHIYAY